MRRVEQVVTLLAVDVGPVVTTIILENFFLTNLKRRQIFSFLDLKDSLLGEFYVVRHEPFQVIRINQPLWNSHLYFV